jgi:cardiolipin synthase A/B
VNLISIFSCIAIVVHLLGILNAAHAVMKVRSSRGAVAWSIALITFPWLAIPFYLVFGRNQFHGYAEALHSAYSEHYALANQAYRHVLEYRASLPESLIAVQELADELIALPFTSGNRVDLLIDGEVTFQAMLAAIQSATAYILLQSYTICDDEIGNQIRKALIEKEQQGVQVYLLYDGIGTRKLSRKYLRSLRRNGAEVKVFKSTKGRGNRWQINFRNHRKILVVDGKIGFVGGLNIADLYLSKKPPLSPWRDTHLKLYGPAVQCLQASFLGDWFWVTRELPEVSWEVKPDLLDQTALVLPTGPADRIPICSLFFINIINQAKHRLWIASPYLVPDDAMLTALKLAAMRGVDVRIILPSRPDHFFVFFCAFSYHTEMQIAGIKLYYYQPGFTHQKVILVDDAIAGVGTVNLDNRSFFLNFEATVFVTKQPFIQQVEQMLQEDLKQCRLIEKSESDKYPLWLKFVARIARLLSPVL